VLVTDCFKLGRTPENDGFSGIRRVFAYRTIDCFAGRAPIRFVEREGSSRVET
jgi:hypothetical protein